MKVSGEKILVKDMRVQNLERLRNQMNDFNEFKVEKFQTIIYTSLILCKVEPLPFW